jgi:hypothetical protein
MNSGLDLRRGRIIVGRYTPDGGISTPDDPPGRPASPDDMDEATTP